MVTKDEALKMAIEAIEFEGARDSEEYWLMMDKVRTVCKEALAQQEQAKADFDVMAYGQSFMKDGKHIPIHKIVQQWVGLSDDEIDKIYYKTYDSGSADIEFARAIEAKLKELNT